MSNEILQAAIIAWAIRGLPGRLKTEEVTELLSCSVDDVSILVSRGVLHPLGSPRPNAVKQFSAIEVITLLADRKSLDEMTKTISAYWRRKNARRKGGKQGGDEGLQDAA